LLVTCSKICCDCAICASICFWARSSNVLNLSSLSLCAFWLFSNFRLGVSKKWSTIARCCSTFVFPDRLWSAQTAWACLLSRLRIQFRLQGWNYEVSYSTIISPTILNFEFPITAHEFKRVSTFQYWLDASLKFGKRRQTSFFFKYGFFSLSFALCFVSYFLWSIF
jgi:hypothetical protein